MFSNFEKDKEIFTATANVCEAMENDDGTKISALISGILASRKNKDDVNNTKKYRKQLTLAEKFEAMTSEERQAYLDGLEKQMRKYTKTIDFFDNSHKEASDESKAVVVDALKTGAEVGICSAVLGMTTAPSEETLGASMLFGLGGAMIGIYSQLAGNEIKDYVSRKKLDRLTEEWVACSIAENTSEMER